MKRRLRRWLVEHGYVNGGYDERGINVALLRRVEQRIRRYPESYDQGWWLLPSEGVGLDQDSPVDEVLAATKQWRTGAPVCGTSACVAGHALLISGRAAEFRRTGLASINYALGARVVLGLEPDQADALFNGGNHAPAMPDLLRALRLGEITTGMEISRFDYEASAAAGMTREENAL